ncbi:hypothetical Protein YC6258_05531 [Gynuella sunshinyii YC6258]|uniref:Uncharacterized protein n=1 Tax=Gynuella sunshinyii YC6258 TaxID=1445510 RepID=A0A0C5W4M0_9GAMM|nr:hypothetical Protein YC6258_05531 [Gynuella sunshinyii YC6258]
MQKYQYRAAITRSFHGPGEIFERVKTRQNRYWLDWITTEDI